jgi:hypothetical protein
MPCALLVAATFVAPVAASAGLTRVQASGRAGVAVSKACHRKGADAAAKELVRTAQVAAETIATDNGGSYARVSPATIHTEEKLIPITPREGRQWAGAYLLSASGTSDSFVVTSRASNGNTFSVRRSSDGEIVQLAKVCGTIRHW